MLISLLDPPGVAEHSRNQFQLERPIRVAGRAVFSRAGGEFGLDQSRELKARNWTH